MTYRSMLVFLDHDRRVDTRVAYALRLAGALECHVVGAAPTGLVPSPFAIPPELPASLVEAAELARSALRQRAEAACARFETACTLAGIASHETVVDHADKALALVRLAHCSDLVVLGQADPAEAESGPWAPTLVADVVLRGARPTLILPYAGQFEAIPSRVMVAWDDSPESARAVSDALPLLRLAQQVEVVAWDEARKHDAQLPECLDALQRWLLWQGVTAESRTVRSEMPLADAMLSHAANLGADLVVMGAYGHARWTERVLGGATRDMLASMTVPVLMSH
jgi:nucleotide-binding universal stress UspA family protein